MYLLTWNPDIDRIEACFGGRVSKPEAQSFLVDLRHMLESKHGQCFKVMFDLCMAEKTTKPVETVLAEARDLCTEAGASRVTFVIASDDDARRRTSERMDGVLQGREQYVSYRAA